MGDAGVLALGSVRSAWAVGLGACVALLSVGSSCSSRSGGDELPSNAPPPNGGSADRRERRSSDRRSATAARGSRWRREKRGGHGLDRRQADRSRQHRRLGLCLRRRWRWWGKRRGRGGQPLSAAGARRAGLRPGARERISGRAVQWQRRRLRRQRRRGLQARARLCPAVFPRGPGTAPRGSVRGRRAGVREKRRARDALGRLQGRILPKPEACDTLDNDCNGCVDDFDDCKPTGSCPGPGDPRIPTGQPLAAYPLRGRDFFMGDAKGWSWTVIGGPATL